MAKHIYPSSTIQTVRQLVPIDDVMFQKICEGKDVCQEIISTILGEDVEVLEVISQYDIMNLQGRSVRLDCLCRLANGTIVNVEVQKTDNDDHKSRVWYNASIITANETRKGSKFRDVAKVIVIYITRFDIFHRNYPIYHVDRILRETGEIRTDVFTEIYANTAVKKYDTNLNRDVSDLMDLFIDRDTYVPEKFPYFSHRKNIFINSEKGENEMCEKVEKLFKEREKELLLNTLFKGVQSGGLRITYAAQEAGLSLNDFKTEMQMRGYIVPQSRSRNSTRSGHNSVTVSH